ncbi:hypothetical protein [Actinomadura litoris]|uniref:Uncharacterized protein n=1 Tax=Actinomadura litoris TaxID=2678616 RepID=A0A7K1LCW7_9ACTN|nr:hypothetical protein [Actinomadura litoris]MUN42096.1 hypothetical protein [Actinomadura litoris]
MIFRPFIREVIPGAWPLKVMLPFSESETKVTPPPPTSVTCIVPSPVAGGAGISSWGFTRTSHERFAHTLNRLPSRACKGRPVLGGELGVELDVELGAADGVPLRGVLGAGVGVSARPSASPPPPHPADASRRVEMMIARRCMAQY